MVPDDPNIGVAAFAMISSRASMGRFGMQAVYAVARACGHVSRLSFSAPTVGEIERHRRAAMRVQCINCFTARRRPMVKGAGRRVGHLTIVK